MNKLSEIINLPDFFSGDRFSVELSIPENRSALTDTCSTFWHSPETFSTVADTEQNLTLEFIETVDLAQRKALRKNPKVSYIKLDIYDSLGASLETKVFHECTLQSIEYPTYNVENVEARRLLVHYTFKSYSFI
jgi:hypothetical protein